MQSKPLISIIIINYRGKTMNVQCMKALAQQTLQNFEVIWVDNNSDDDSQLMLQQWLGADEPLTNIPNYLAQLTNQKLLKNYHFYPQNTAHPFPTYVIALNENTGFAGGNNHALALAQGEWLVLLNNDAFPNPDWLEKLIQASEHYTEFNFFSSRQFNYHQPHLLDGTGDIVARNGRAWRRDYNTPVAEATAYTGEVFAACAAAAMYRTHDVRAIGGFDTDFFCHFEDVDLAFRLRLMGGRCLYVHDAVVYHVGSATIGGEDSDFALYQGLRNSVWAYLKNMPKPLLKRYFFSFMKKNIRDVISGFRRGRGRIILKAKIHALLKLRTILKKRQYIQQKAIVSAEAIDALLVFDNGHSHTAKPHGRNILIIRETLDWQNATPKDLWQGEDIQSLIKRWDMTSSLPFIHTRANIKTIAEKNWQNIENVEILTPKMLDATQLTAQDIVLFCDDDDWFSPDIFVTLRQHCVDNLDAIIWADGVYGIHFHWNNNEKTKHTPRYSLYLETLRFRSLNEKGVYSKIKTNNYAVNGLWIKQQGLEKVLSHASAATTLTQSHWRVLELPTPLSVANRHPCSTTVLRGLLENTQSADPLQEFLHHYAKQKHIALPENFRWAMPSIRAMQQLSTTLIAPPSL